MARGDEGGMAGHEGFVNRLTIDDSIDELLHHSFDRSGRTTVTLMNVKA